MMKYIQQSSMTLAQPEESPTGLFDTIISAIHHEKESHQTRKILLGFFIFLVVSLATLPLSSLVLVKQWNNSGVSHFIFAALGSPDIAFANWQDFGLSIIQSLPIMAITMLAANIALALFTVRLFLYRKGLLLRYARDHFFLRHG